MPIVKKTVPRFVVVRLAKMNGELTRVEIPYDEATTTAIASAVIDIIHSCMALDIGDMITVSASPD